MARTLERQVLGTCQRPRHLSAPPLPSVDRCRRQVPGTCQARMVLSKSTTCVVRLAGQAPGTALGVPGTTGACERQVPGTCQRLAPVSVCQRHPGTCQRHLSAPAGRKIQKVVLQWSRARELARSAAGKGFRVSMKRYFTDVFVVDPESGDFLLIGRKMGVVDASRFTVAWARNDRESGCLLWPHESPTPVGWRVVRVKS